MSLQATEAESAAVAKAPRVSLDDIVAAIAARFEFRADAAAARAVAIYGGAVEVPAVIASLEVLSICLLVMRNGFTVIGKSAPASRENFDAEIGRKFAYEDAVRQIWPLMGFALRDKLAGL